MTGLMIPEVAEKLISSGVTLVKDALRDRPAPYACPLAKQRSNLHGMSLCLLPPCPPSAHGLWLPRAGRGAFMRKSVERVMEVPVSWLVQSNTTGGVSATLDIPDPTE